MNQDPSKQTITLNTDLNTMIRACELSLASTTFLDFVKFIFKGEGKTFIVGRHTKEICQKIDIALENLFKHRISSYLLLTVPFRHGKTELVSRLLPPYIIGKYGTIPENNPHNIRLEFILGCYNKDLASGFSKHAKKYIQSSAFKELFPLAATSKESAAAAEWATDLIDPATGNRSPLSEFHAAGMLSGVTGKGASIQIIDDILKNREEAESQTYRDKQWDSYTDDFLTRLAPEFLHILCATRWHIDDVLGRVLAKNDPTSDKYDPKFPIYDVLHYEAKSQAPQSYDPSKPNDPSQPNSQYLFPERFSDDWYESRFATLGPYSAAALLQGNPVAKGGNMFPTDKIRLIESIPPSLLEQSLPVRFWDLASTAKEQVKDDPDATVGCKGFVWFPDATPSTPPEELKPHFFVLDMRSCRQLATERNKLIMETAISDPEKVEIGVEAVAGYKDAATTIKALLRGIRAVAPVNVRRDKFTRASELIPPMDAGWVYFLKGWWNTESMTELSQFPSGKHDDYVDAMSGCYSMAYTRALRLLQSGYLGGAGFSSGSHLMKRYTDDLNPISQPKTKTLEEEFNELFDPTSTTTPPHDETQTETIPEER